MRLGCCVAGSSPQTLWRLDALGVSAVSLPLVAHADPPQLDYLKAVRASGRQVLGVVDARTFSDPLDWRGSAERAFDWLATLTTSGLVTHLAVGREWDDGFGGFEPRNDPLACPRGGTGSWVLSTSELTELTEQLSARLGPRRRVPLLLGGVCSGHAGILGALDLARFDGILVHPYGAGIGPDAADRLGGYLDRIRAEVRGQGLGTSPFTLTIGELGRSDQVISRGGIADWFGQTLGYLDRRGDVEAAYIYCDSDLTEDGYGQYDPEERGKPSISAIYLAGLHLDTDVEPTDPEDPEDLEPEDGDGDDDEPAWADRAFTAEQIATALAGQASAGLVSAIERLWPAFEPWLDQLGASGSIAARIALLATIWVRTGGRFEPLTEASRYDRSERLYGRETSAGRTLGNRYDGDGDRYRGRGLLPFRGRIAYATYGDLLDLPLLAQPELLNEPAVAAGTLALLCGELGLLELAERGNYHAVWGALDPGLNGYDAFIQAVEALWASVDQTTAPDPPEAPRSVFETARARVGEPYQDGGSRPGGFDGPGLIAWAYQTALGVPLAVDPDAMLRQSRPIGPDQAGPGDLVLYLYDEPARGGAVVGHVGLVTDRPELVLDARPGLGVGYRPRIRGAVRRYRRVSLAVPVPRDPGPIAATETLDAGEDEAMWQARYEALVDEAEALAELLYAEQARLAAIPLAPSVPNASEVKATWVAFGQRAGRWQEHASATINEGVGRIGQIADALVAIPTRVEEETDGDVEAEEPVEQQQQQQEAEGGGQEDDGQEAP